MLHMLRWTVPYCIYYIKYGIHIGIALLKTKKIFLFFRR